MLNLTIECVELGPSGMLKLVKEGHRVRETPHLGGPYSGKYALTLGGLASRIVLVDTVSASRDKFGKTQDVAGIRLISNREGENVPAAAMTNFALEGTKKGAKNNRLTELDGILADLGITDTGRFVSQGRTNFVALHTHCTQLVVADGTSVSTFADLWRQSGEAAIAMMEYMARGGMLERWYNAEIKEIVEVGDADQLALLRNEGRYFDPDNEVHGILPPVEAMLAIEAVRAVTEGRTVTYDHLYVSSTEYTKNQAINDRVRDIACGTLALLGGYSSGEVAYRYIIADNAWMDLMGTGTNHFDMIRAGQKFNATALIGLWEAANSPYAEHLPVPIKYDS